MKQYIPPEPRLKVILAPLRHGHLEDLKLQVFSLLEKEKKQADKNGSALPLAILFAENSLNYNFRIKSCVVKSNINKIQEYLPADRWVAIGFSVNEKDDYQPRSMGYLFTIDKLEPTPKRYCTYGDKELLRKIYEKKGNEFIDQWDEDGRIMQISGKPFAMLTTPSGINLELRVCADVLSPPIKKEKNAVTIVPADGITVADAIRLAKKRAAVIIHDNYPEVNGRWPENLYLSKFKHWENEIEKSAGVLVESINN
ncbi:MAG: hypothetical protein ABIH83_00455 [Candidatus Micrarchaeota archaeon]